MRQAVAKKPFVATRLALLLALAVVVCAPGCAGTKRDTYLNRQVNFSLVRRVAVLPLENFTNDVHAGEKVQQILMIELLKAKAFEIADETETIIALNSAKVDKPSDMTREQMKKVGDSLQVQALLMGTVQDLGVESSSGAPAPRVSLQFLMADAATGETIWSTVVSREGVALRTRLFGVGGASTNQTIEKLVKDALATLIK